LANSTQELLDFGGRISPRANGHMVIRSERAASLAIRGEQKQTLRQILLYFVLIGATIASSTIIARWVHPLP
jgi:hypothetical protein